MILSTYAYRDYSCIVTICSIFKSITKNQIMLRRWEYILRCNDSSKKIAFQKEIITYNTRMSAPNIEPIIINGTCGQTINISDR